MPSAFQQLSSVRVAHNFTRAPRISEMARRGPVLKWLGTEPVILLQYRFTKDGNNMGITPPEITGQSEGSWHQDS